MVLAVVLVGGGIGFVRNLRAGVSKPIYLFRADAACGNAAAAPAPAPATSYPELTAAGGAVVTSVDAHLGQLALLSRPGGADGLPVNGIVTSLQATRDAAQRVRDAAGASDDAATVNASKDLGARFGEAGSQARAYGFTVCGAGLQAGVDSMIGGAQSVVKTSFVAKADNLCRAAARQDADIPEPRNDSARELAQYLNEESALFDKLLADLKALPMPPADEVVVAEMLTAQEAVNAKARELRDAIVNEDETRFLAADRALLPLITAADSKLDAYGLPSCGSNFGEI